MAMLHADDLQGFTRLALHAVPTFLVIGLVSLGRPCVAQEVGVPETPDVTVVSGSVVAPSGWLELIVPVRDRIDLQLYGFYIGNLKVPVAQFDLPIKTTDFLTITPSYMYYRMPASGLNELTDPPGGGFTEAYAEHQFRTDGTFTINIRRFQISNRNMYVRRFRPSPQDDINRYRNRTRITYALPIKGQSWNPFAAYEAYYNEGIGWNTDRGWVGVTLPLAKSVWLQPSYLWEATDGIKDIHYLLLGLIIRAPS